MNGIRFPRAFAFLMAALLALAACTQSDDNAADRSSEDGAGPDSGGTQSLTLMEFNIEYGGDGVSFDSVIEAIEKSGADLVAVEEAEDAIPKIAEELGWPYYDEARSLVSRKKIISPPGNENTFAFIELEPGKVAPLANIHLTSSPYGPNLIRRKDYTIEQVLRNEQHARMGEINAILEKMTPYAEQGYPTFIMGDFNTPSHRDWTDETVGARPQMKYAVEWPVTLAVEGAGFVDSYRAINPDPVGSPGLTWPAWRPDVEKGWNPPPDSSEDRIDMIFSSGPATATDSWVMGEEGAESSDDSVDPWPTDHRAVISSFDVDTAAIPPLPNLVSVMRPLVDVGEQLEVTFHAPGEEGEVVEVTSEGQSVDEASTEGQADGSVTFETAAWSAASHEVTLRGSDGSELSTLTVWVLDPDEGPTISTGKKAYEVGEAIDIDWYGAPANRWDWVGTFPRGGKNGEYIQYEYTGATVVGETKINGGSPGPWPLEPGKYSVRLLLNDGYKSVAESDFVVKG